MLQTVLQALKRSVSHRHPMRLFWHQAKAFVAACFHGFPARKLTVIGVTGTDGKTTTVGMIDHILRSVGYRTGSFSTAFHKIGEHTHWNDTQKTSPSPFIVQRFLLACVRAGCTHVVLEYSSHGLVQHRMDYTWPIVAAITNTSPEHLDYHGTLEQYRMDKGLLFRMLRKRGAKILNVTDPGYECYKDIPSDRTLLYSENEISEINYSLPVIGEFNRMNALCALRFAKALGIDLQKAHAALRSFNGVPGRMECIQKTPFSVYIDFTVTPAAYQKTLSAARELLQPGKRLLVLTGSCGDRMKEKRPLIGKICSEFADIVVVANEDPYTEDPEKIIDAVWAGIDHQKGFAYRISDRKQAIFFLLQQAKEGDIVLLCGKGADTTMWTKEGQIPWNEKEIVKELLSTAPRSSPQPYSNQKYWNRQKLPYA